MVQRKFTVLRSLGRQSERLANNYISYASNVRRIRQQLWFNHRCKDLVLVPAEHSRNHQIVRATCRRLIKARINDCHRRLNYYNRLQHTKDKKRRKAKNWVKNISSRPLDETNSVTVLRTETFRYTKTDTDRGYRIQC